MLVSIKIAAEIVGVCTKTLRRWDAHEKLKPTLRTAGGHRRYESTTLKQQLTGSTNTLAEAAGTNPEVPERVVGYARVSAPKQREDLARQKTQIQTYAAQHQWHLETIYQDIASGLNDTRPGLRALITACLQGSVDRVLITYDDRLARFGTALLEWLFTTFHVRLERVQPGLLPQSLDQQLLEDLLALMTSFSGKFHRLRRGKNRKQDRKQDCKQDCKQNCKQDR